MLACVSHLPRLGGRHPGGCLAGSERCLGGGRKLVPLSFLQQCAALARHCAREMCSSRTFPGLCSSAFAAAAAVRCGPLQPFCMAVFIVSNVFRRSCQPRPRKRSMKLYPRILQPPLFAVDSVDSEIGTFKVPETSAF